VEDRARVAVSAGVGALVGGLVGYLFLTAAGRRLRERLDPGLDEVLGELRRLGEAAERAMAAAADGFLTLRSFRRGLGPRTAGGDRNEAEGY